MEILQNIWLALVSILLGLFLVLGAFDFGACILSARSRKTGDFAIASIAPFWDANQVWLITAGGALFAAFPSAYSSILSQMYIPVMLLLAAIAARVVAIEFYFVKDSPLWRITWRIAACASSLLAIFLIGVALCAIYTGKIFTRANGFPENILGLFDISTLFAGLALLAYSIVHGGLFLCTKSDEGAQMFYSKTKKFFCRILIIFPLYILSLKIDLLDTVIFTMAFLSLISAFALFLQQKFALAIALNGIFLLITLFAHVISIYPNIVPPEITIANSSSMKTLSIILGVAAICVPIILAYTIYTYRIFLKKRSS